MKFIWLLIVAIPLALSSCSMTDEQGSRGGQQLIGDAQGGLLAAAPDTYRWRHWQFGGVVQWQNSMGSSLTADNQASFKDAMQAATATISSVYSFKAYAESQITQRLAEGELTKRQATELRNKLALVQTQADVDKFIAAIPK